MCTGRPPFRASATLAVLKRVAEDAPRPIREIIPETPLWLCEIIAKLHAKNPDDRFQSAREVADALADREAQFNANTELTDSPGFPIGKPRRSRRWQGIAAAALLLPCLALTLTETAGLTQLFRGQPPTHDPVKADRGLAPIQAAEPPVAAPTLFSDAVLLMSFAKDTFYQKNGKTYVRDLSGHGNDGWCDNVAFTSDGKAGGGLLCQGGQLRLAKSLINRQPNYTIIAWCRCEKPGPAHTAQHLYQTAVPEKLNEACFDVYFPPERNCYVNAWHADLAENWIGASTGVTTIPAGWFFVAIALTDGETGKGKLRIVIDDRIHVRTSQMVASDAQKVDAAGYNINGVIDELAVFQRALSDEEIMAVRAIGQKGIEFGPIVRIEPKEPFAILARGPRAERRFGTLAEAVNYAGHGETIEIRGNGPFVTDPVLITGRAMTIRAAEGFTPVLRLSPKGTKAASPLLESDSALVLEGLELQRVGEVDWHHKPPPRTVCSRQAPLFVANCRFLLKSPGAGILAEGSPVCAVRNCEFLDTGQSVGQVGWTPPDTGRLTLENSVGSGDAGLSIWLCRRAFADMSVRLAHNTLVARVPILLFLNPEGGFFDDGPPIRLEAYENILEGQDGILDVRQWNGSLVAGKPRPTNEIEQLLPRLVAWRAERNLYHPSNGFLSHSSVEELPQPSPRIKSLEDWRRLWGSPDSAAVQGRPSYQGGNLFARSSHAPEKLSSSDFRLSPDRIGYRAGKEARDLGADVDLVGPGKAYERWKKSPEYAQWLKDTGRALAGE